MNTHASRATGRGFCWVLATLFLALVWPVDALASVIKIPIKVELAKTPTIKVTIKDKDGKAVELVGELDTGNEDGFIINQKTADKLGLKPEGKHPTQGIGQATPQEAPVVDFKGDQAPTIDVKQDGVDKTLPLTGKGTIAEGVEDDHIVFGQSFFALFGKEEVDKVNKEATYTFTDQVPKKGAFLPFEKPMDTELGGGTFTVVGEPGPAHFVDLDLSFGGATTSTAFVIGSGFDISLISAATAAALGLATIGLPTQIVSTLFGDITVPVAALHFRIFAPEQLKPHLFGILADSQNPGGINVLGSDILGRYSSYSIDVVNARFSAVPEPSILAFMAIGLFGLASRRAHRHG